MYRYCGKTWTFEDIERIRGIIVGSSQASRLKLSRMVCEAFSWRSHNGKLKEMSCRVAMLRMHRDGLIKLPPAKCVMFRSSGIFISKDSDPQPERSVALSDFSDLHVELVTNRQSRRLWNEFVGRYHYLGYKMLPGAQLRYFILDGEYVLGAFGFGAAAWQVADRDRFIGWTSKQRESGLNLIVNQSRFLILPWIHCKNLATKSLAIVVRRLPGDWQAYYGYRPVLMETFVDTTRFSGTCYRAGNWINVGLTQGRSRNEKSHAKIVPVKSIWLLPLHADFRSQLCGR